MAAAKRECLSPARQGHCCLVAVCLASRPPGSLHRSDPLAACPPLYPGGDRALSQPLLTLDKKPKSGRAGSCASNKIPSVALDPAGQGDAGRSHQQGQGQAKGEVLEAGFPTLWAQWIFPRPRSLTATLTNDQDLQTSLALRRSQN